MRQRRTGDPSKVRRPGPAVDPARAVFRELHREWSERTFDRYWWSFKVLQLSANRATFGAPYEAAIARGHGSDPFNVAYFERTAHRALFKALQWDRERGVRDPALWCLFLRATISAADLGMVLPAEMASALTERRVRP